MLADWYNAITRSASRGTSQSWIRLGIVALVLLATVYLAQSPSPMFILLPIAAAVGMIILRYPAFGILALIPVALAVPIEIGGNTVGGGNLNAALAYSMLVIFLWIFDMVVNRRDVRLVKSRLNAPALGLAVVATLSFIVGQLPWVKFVQGAKLLPQLAGLGIVILSVGVFLATANHVKEMKILVWITWGFLAVGAFYLALNIIPGAGGFSVYFFQSAGSIFWIWTIVVSFSQAVYNRRLALHWRGLIGLLCLGLVYLAAQNSDWASGWLPPMVGIVMILLAVDIRFGLIAVLAGVAFAIPNAIHIFNQLAQTGTEAYSWMTRVEAWRIVAEIIKVNPVLGLGPSNYYHYTPLYSILGFYLRFNSHNQYVDLIAQFGLLGLAFYLWLFWELFRLCWRLKSQVEEGFQRAYIYGALGGIAGLLAAGMLGDWVLPFVYNVGTGGFRTSVISWVFLGGAVAIEQMKKTELNDKANSAINSGH